MGGGTRSTSEWTPRPLAGRLIRASLFIIPFIAGWLAIRFTKAYFIELATIPALISWVAQAIVVSVAASFAASRALSRLTPLPTLFNMTLVFPDHAPSRFSIALRSGTVRKLLEDEDLTLSSDAQRAAEQAIVLVQQLATHERLTRGHTERVRAHADLIGQQLGLDETEMNQLRWGTLLHDVGKLKVPAEILSKPGAPTAEEWTILRQHPAAAVAILKPFEPWLGSWILAASEHHERWDGTGYPLGLSGSDISLAGRITAVADAYDVITSRRSYKSPMPLEEARRELVASAGTHFDPAIVRAMLEVGLDEQHRVNPFGWLFELPGVTRAFEVGVATPLAAAASALVAIGLSTVPNEPVDLAFVETTTTVTVAEGDIDSLPETTSTIVSTATQPTASSVVTTTPTSTVDSTTTSTLTQTTSTAAPTTTAPTTTTPTTTAAPTTTAPASGETVQCELARSGETTDQPNTDLAGCDFSGFTIDQLNLAGSDLQGADFSNATITSFNMTGANIAGANFTGATFTDGSFSDSVLTNISAQGSVLTRISLDRGALQGINLDDATLDEVSLIFSGLTGASLQRVDISNVEITSSDLTDVNLTNATLTTVSFSFSNLTRTNFFGAVFNAVTAEGNTHQATICRDGTVTDVNCF